MAEEEINPLMVLPQRQKVLSSIPENGSMLEWGSGGTTIWLLENMEPTQRLVSVEHHGDWARRVDALSCEYTNYEMRYCCADRPGEVGKNATAFEENPSALDAYINQPDIENYDVFLVDGVARGACLMTIYERAKSGAKVLLHDAQRPWYQWALRSHRILDAGKLDGGMMVNYPHVKAPDLWFCTLA